MLNGSQCFSHGQVYVAMSRVTRIDDIRIFSPSTCNDESSYIRNVVYHELLDGNTERVAMVARQEVFLDDEEGHEYY